MALQLGATREVFLEAGVSPASASKAAEELASYETRLANNDARISVFTWMVGANITLTILVLGSLFALWSKVADIAAAIARIPH
jgi:hypothetical protein